MVHYFAALCPSHVAVTSRSLVSSSGSLAVAGGTHPELSGLEPPPRENESSRQNLLGQREMLYVTEPTIIAPHIP